MKLLIIGIDSMDPRLLFENIDMFPNMKKMYQDGAHASYDAYAYGYGSRDNWVTIYTGLTPQQHGVINNKCLNTNKAPNYNDYKDKQSFWKVASKKEISSGIWRGLSMSPGEKINGYMLTGERESLSGREVEYQSTKPTSFRTAESIDDLIGDEIENISLGAPRSLDAFGLSWEDSIKGKGDIDLILSDDYYLEGLEYIKKELSYYSENIIKVNRKNPVDLLFYYNFTFDLLQHFQYHDPGKKIVLKAMLEVDNFIGELNRELNPENIIVLSDHGMSSFAEAIPTEDLDVQRESFGLRDKAVWLKNGQIVIKGDNGGIMSAFHDIKGTFLASGEMIKNKKIKEMRSVDIYPTILELLGVKVLEGREGYVLDILKKENFSNDKKILKEDSIKREKIALIANTPVYEFNRIINEVFLENRFADLTIYCNKKYESIYKANPRLDKVIGLESKSIDISEIKNSYKKVYIENIEKKVFEELKSDNEKDRYRIHCL